VSELLGSFGDNELSPECLWEVEWLLTRDNNNNNTTTTTTTTTTTQSLQLQHHQHQMF
jgi:hypothetical protein